MLPRKVRVLFTTCRRRLDLPLASLRKSVTMTPTRLRLARRGAQGREMIRVKSIQISRFRGIREGAVRDFADVNLLVGRNNSGKSTVVEAVHRVAYSHHPNSADP